jgi:hypothetical protein
LFLSTFNKEILLVICLYFSYGYTRKKCLKFEWIFVIYALLLRPYLLMVPVMMRLGKLRAIFVFIMFLIFALLSFELTAGLIYDLFNRRMGSKIFDANSEIIQTVYVDSIGSFVMMLIEVMPQIFLPFFLDASVKNFIFQFYIWIIVIMVFISRSKYTNTIGFLLMLYVVLDPDLGALFRHLVTFFILYPYIIYDIYDRKKIAIK